MEKKKKRGNERLTFKHKSKGSIEQKSEGSIERKTNKEQFEEMITKKGKKGKKNPQI